MIALLALPIFSKDFFKLFILWQNATKIMATAIATIWVDYNVQLFTAYDTRATYGARFFGSIYHT
ncbi:MAG: hypothetical protein COU11_03585 [Candidatus Harrisonbacteria bacterium CG10_big_fil_rev_8_21_14_0_10_49_15]|uniref:Uncharacterized protein n=1 Tax=Candidatus Harrisonbacteria bacterium CG10_big_fil_rev_8_21_14_0_10_49_15 TaxID=1974587 RepID=A0A2H0UKI2_9BACT|nr:MAG: hypothetical protein COU11_03585 [Candidatus Harrisonbacteria bacterium CG10_big_fil_rev_8_21_14_0_10_49_15]